MSAVSLHFLRFGVPIMAIVIELNILLFAIMMRMMLAMSLGREEDIIYIEAKY